jgi:hypothetical protein
MLSLNMFLNGSRINNRATPLLRIANIFLRRRRCYAPFWRGKSLRGKTIWDDMCYAPFGRSKSLRGKTICDDWCYAPFWRGKSLRGKTICDEWCYAPFGRTKEGMFKAGASPRYLRLNFGCGKLLRGKCLGRVCSKQGHRPDIFARQRGIIYDKGAAPRYLCAAMGMN